MLHYYPMFSRPVTLHHHITLCNYIITFLCYHFSLYYDTLSHFATSGYVIAASAAPRFPLNWIIFFRTRWTEPRSGFNHFWRLSLPSPTSCWSNFHFPFSPPMIIYSPFATLRLSSVFCFPSMNLCIALALYWLTQCSPYCKSSGQESRKKYLHAPTRKLGKQPLALGCTGMLKPKAWSKGMLTPTLETLGNLLWVTSSDTICVLIGPGDAGGEESPDSRSPCDSTERHLIWCPQGGEMLRTAEEGVQL